MSASEQFSPLPGPDGRAASRLLRRLGLEESDAPVLLQALTHPAWFEGQPHHSREDNQRLEYLGDAVLDLIAGEYLYRAHPEAREGDLSKMRAFIVCEASLAQGARQLGLGRALRLGRGSENNGDRQRPSVLADAFEAVIGAVFLLHGYEKARDLFLQLFGDKMDRLTRQDYEDKKSLLQEVVQTKSPHGVVYHVLSSSGPTHAPCFSSAACCGQLQLGIGQGKSKKESEIAAAADALARQEEWMGLI